MNITNDIKYIGVDDAELKLFESQYDLPEGMCYNSYVLMDDKVAIIDTTDQRKVDEWTAAGGPGRPPGRLSGGAAHGARP